MYSTAYSSRRAMRLLMVFLVIGQISWRVFVQGSVIADDETFEDDSSNHRDRTADDALVAADNTTSDLIKAAMDMINQGDPSGALESVKSAIIGNGVSTTRPIRRRLSVSDPDPICLDKLPDDGADFDCYTHRLRTLDEKVYSRLIDVADVLGNLDQRLQAIRDNLMNDLGPDMWSNWFPNLTAKSGVGPSTVPDPTDTLHVRELSNKIQAGVQDLASGLQDAFNEFNIINILTNVTATLDQPVVSDALAGSIEDLGTIISQSVGADVAKQTVNINYLVDMVNGFLQRADIDNHNAATQVITNTIEMMKLISNHTPEVPLHLTCNLSIYNMMYIKSYIYVCMYLFSMTGSIMRFQRRLWMLRRTLRLIRC